MHWMWAHLIGDYLIQNDWMAQHKKDKGMTGNIRCGIHILTYMIPFLLCGFVWWQLALIAVQHYLIDRTHFVEWFMDKKGSHIFATNVCFPWSQIVVDNVLHVLWIAFIVWIPKVL